MENYFSWKEWAYFFRVVTHRNNIVEVLPTKLFDRYVEIVQDDIFSPRIRIYEGAKLVYSIRPPTEIVQELLNLSSILGFDVLVRPYSDEEGGYTYPKKSGWQQVLYRRSVFYWLTEHSDFRNAYT